MFFFLLLAVVLMVPIGQNIAAGELMIRGEESYYHLVKAQEAQWYEAQYLPLTWTLKILPEKGLIFLMADLLNGYLDGNMKKNKFCCD